MPIYRLLPLTGFFSFLRRVTDSAARRGDRSFPSLVGRARTSILRDTYFDTSDRQLHARHVNLRVRVEDEICLLTLKGPKTRLRSGERAVYR